MSCLLLHVWFPQGSYSTWSWCGVMSKRYLMFWLVHRFFSAQLSTHEGNELGNAVWSQELGKKVVCDAAALISSDSACLRNKCWASISVTNAELFHKIPSVYHLLFIGLEIGWLSSSFSAQFNILLVGYSIFFSSNDKRNCRLTDNVDE